MSVPSSGKPTDRFSVTPITPVESPPATPSDAPTSTRAPSMHAVNSNRHAELLQILKDIDALPPEALVKGRHRYESSGPAFPRRIQYRLRA